MKRIKSLLCLALILLCVFPITACSSKVGKAKVIDIDLTSEEYAVGVDKTQPRLQEEVNDFVKRIKADGTLDVICEKYFGAGTPMAIESAKYDEAKDQLVVATSASFPPFEYMQGNKYYGIDMEIAKLLADELGKELVIQNMDFDAVCLSVGQQKCDIAMAGLTIKAEREESVTFSIPYYQASQRLVVPADDTTFDACKDAEEVVMLLNKLAKDDVIGVQNGTTGLHYVEGDEEWGFKGLPVTCSTYKDASLAIQDMLNGNNKYVIIDAAPAQIVTESINEMDSFEKKIEKFADMFVREKGYQKVLDGLKNTLLIAITGLLIGVALGTVIATIRVLPMYKLLPRVLNGICSFYVALFRGTPMVVQLLVFYYVLLPIMGLRITGVEVSILVFGLNSGAYISEIMRGGIQSVDRGQMEAGRALGLSFGTSMVKIVIPQAIKNMLPTMGNEFIALIKETSVVSFVGATDLYMAFNYIGSNSYEFMVPYLVMAVIYIILVLLITLLIKLMERSLQKSDRRN